MKPIMGATYHFDTGHFNEAERLIERWLLARCPAADLNELGASQQLDDWQIRVDHLKEEKLVARRYTTRYMKDGLSRREAHVWLEDDGDGCALTLLERALPDDTPLLDPIARLSQLARALVTVLNIELDDQPLGRIQKINSADTWRLFRWLERRDRVMPAVITDNARLADLMVEEYPWVAHVCLLDDEASKAWNREREGYHHLSASKPKIHTFGPNGVSRRGHAYFYINAGHDQAIWDTISHAVKLSAEQVAERTVTPAVDAQISQSQQQRNTNLQLDRIKQRLQQEKKRAQRQLQQELKRTQRQIKQEVEAQVRADFDASTRDSLREELADELLDEVTKLENALEEERQARAEADAQAAEFKNRNLYLEFEIARLRHYPSHGSQPGQASQPDLHALKLGDLSGLESLTQGALAFTSSAHKSWSRRHPHASELWACLVKLGEAAMIYRDLNGAVGDSLSSWLQAQVGHPCPFDDEGLVKRGLDTFEHEGATYSRVPHIKVKDQCAFSGLGRIYFAHDLQGQRFIVDHAAGKLYKPY